MSETDKNDDRKMSAQGQEEPVVEQFDRDIASNIMRGSGMGPLMDAGDARILAGAQSPSVNDIQSYLANIRSAVERAVAEERQRTMQVPPVAPVAEAAINQATRNMPEAERTQTRNAFHHMMETDMSSARPANENAEGQGPKAAPGQSFSMSSALGQGMIQSNYTQSWMSGMKSVTEAEAAEVERRRILRAGRRGIEPMAVRSAELNRSAGSLSGLKDRLKSKVRAVSNAVSSTLFLASMKTHDFLASSKARTMKQTAMAMSLGVVAGTGLLHAMPWVADHFHSAMQAGNMPQVNLHANSATIHDQFASMGRGMAAQDIGGLTSTPATDPMTQYASLSHHAADGMLNGIGRTTGLNYDFASLHMPAGPSPLYASMDPARYGMPSQLVDTGALSFGHVGPTGMTNSPQINLGHDLGGLGTMASHVPSPDAAAPGGMSPVFPDGVDPKDHAQFAATHHGQHASHATRHDATHHHAVHHTVEKHGPTTDDLNKMSFADAANGRTFLPSEVAGTPPVQQQPLHDHHHHHHHHGATPAAQPAAKVADATPPATPAPKHHDFNMHFVGTGIREAGHGITSAWKGMERFFGFDQPDVTKTAAAAPAPAPTPTPKPKGPGLS